MSVGRICSRTTHLADPEESAQAAAGRMKDQNVGTLLVVDGARKPVGIVTDRDIALRVVAAGLDPHKATVGHIMTSHPRCVQERVAIEDAVATMRGLGVRRLPVVDAEEHLAGILSIDDVLGLVTEELSNLGRIVDLSHPGAGVPETRPSRAKSRHAVAAGLERSASDLQC